MHLACGALCPNCCTRLNTPRLPPAPPRPAQASLQDIFRQYEAFGARDAATGLEGRSWAKLCKDAGLYCKKYTTTDADLTFTKASARGCEWAVQRASAAARPPTPARIPGSRPQVKGKAGKKINFAQFEQALELVAEKKVRCG